jgi:hypothetical protein
MAYRGCAGRDPGRPRDSSGADVAGIGCVTAVAWPAATLIAARVHPAGVLGRRREPPAGWSARPDASAQDTAQYSKIASLTGLGSERLFGAFVLEALHTARKATDAESRSRWIPASLT